MSDVPEKMRLSSPTHMESLKATPMLRLQVVRHGDDWRSGDAITPHGIVSIYDQGHDGNRPHTRFDFVANGRLHIASWDRTFSDRFLVTLACRFAAGRAALHQEQDDA